MHLGVGIDRLDYTKGINEKFLAIERLLEIHPEFRGRFVFVQIAESLDKLIQSKRERLERNPLRLLDSREPAMQELNALELKTPVLLDPKGAPPHTRVGLPRGSPPLVISSSPSIPDGAFSKGFSAPSVFSFVLAIASARRARQPSARQTQVVSA